MKSRKSVLIVLALAFLGMVISMIPVFGGMSASADADVNPFGPACCRYSNECPGSQTCGSSTGCSAGAPYHCEGGGGILF